MLRTLSDTSLIGLSFEDCGKLDHARWYTVETCFRNWAQPSKVSGTVLQ